MATPAMWRNRHKDSRLLTRSPLLMSLSGGLTRPSKAFSRFVFSSISASPATPPAGIVGRRQLATQSPLVLRPPGTAGVMYQLPAAGGRPNQRTPITSFQSFKAGRGLRDWFGSRFRSAKEGLTRLHHIPAQPGGSARQKGKGHRKGRKPADTRERER